MKKPALAALAVLAALILSGCTVTSGVFTGFAQHSGETSLSASYQSFDGSISRRLSLKAGDTVTFGWEGGALEALVEQDGEQRCAVADGASYTVPEDGRYAFTVRGRDTDGAFSLTWSVEAAPGS